VTSALGNVASLAVRAGGSVVRQVRSALDPTNAGSSGAAEEPASRWLVVSLNVAPAEVDADRLPPQLAEYGSRIEVRVRPAADAKGTELAVRLREPEQSGSPARGRREDLRGALRSALRKAKQVIEVGEVLRVDPTPHGKRTATPGGGVLETITRHAGKEGLR
jgi:hypothetical protein